MGWSHLWKYLPSSSPGQLSFPLAEFGITTETLTWLWCEPLLSSFVCVRDVLSYKLRGFKYYDPPDNLSLTHELSALVPLSAVIVRSFSVLSPHCLGFLRINSLLVWITGQEDVFPSVLDVDNIPEIETTESEKVIKKKKSRIYVHLCFAEEILAYENLIPVSVSGKDSAQFIIPVSEQFIYCRRFKTPVTSPPVSLNLSTLSAVFFLRCPSVGPQVNG